MNLSSKIHQYELCIKRTSDHLSESFFKIDYVFENHIKECYIVRENIDFKVGIIMEEILDEIIFGLSEEIIIKSKMKRKILKAFK